MHRSLRLLSMTKGLLRDGRLIAYGLPVPRAANPHPGIAIGTAKILPELVTFHVGPGSHHGGVAIDAHHHVAHIDGFIAKLTAFTSRDGVLLGRNLSQGRDRDIVLSEGTAGEFRVAVDAGFAGLPFHVHDLADRRLIRRIDGRSRMNRYMLARKGR